MQGGVMGGQLKGRVWAGVALAGAVLAFVMVLWAPIQGGGNLRGSTYSLAPSGYGAWYAYMAERGTPVQRWEKSIDAWTETTPETTTTLIRINAQSPRDYDAYLDQQELEEWVATGHRLVVVGRSAPVTEAPFRTVHGTDQGTVVVETARRQSPGLDQEIVLGDGFGAIVTRTTLGEGQLVVINPPYLGANAYQGASGNFEFLAQVVSSGEGPVWVDEYLHGYQELEADAGATATESGDWIQYLLATPLGLILFQGLVALGLGVIARNRRFGVKLPLVSPVEDNTAAYVQALGGVLRKAESHDFVVQMLQQAELQQVCRRLGVVPPKGEAMPDRDALLQAWCDQTDGSAADLQPLLDPQGQQGGRRWTETQLLRWLATVAQVRRRLHL